MRHSQADSALLDEPPSPPSPSAARVRRQARMFICDPVCVLPFGHNPPAMTYFRRFFAPQFERIECCVGLPFAAAAAEAHGFRRVFRYLYNDVLPAEHDADELAPSDDDAAWPNDAASRIARQDYADLMARESLARRDVVFLPSADFYSIQGAVAALREIPVAAAPALLIRLIGVMEHATHVVLDPLRQLCGLISAALHDGYRVLLAAETPIYAHSLAARFDLDVAMLPYPLLTDAIPLPADGPFVVASAGSARFDKGYLDLLPIIRAVRHIDEGLPIDFRIQQLTDRHAAHHQGYTNQLYAIPGVELLPAVLSSTAMHDLYAGCHAVVMPYERSIYALRGSAVLMEALAYARHTIARDGLGFSSQIAYYQNGDLCTTNEQFATAIVAAARTPRSIMQRRLTMARARYQHDTASLYRLWTEQCHD